MKGVGGGNIQAASRVYWVWHGSPSTWKQDIISRLKYDFIQRQCQGVSVGRKGRRTWSASNSWLPKWLFLGACRLSEWLCCGSSLEEWPKSNAGMPRERREESQSAPPPKTFIVSLLVNAPLAFMPSSPCLPCGAHGAKRCNSTLSCWSYCSVSFLNYSRNKSIIWGSSWFPVAGALQPWLIFPTNTSYFHYTLHIKLHLLLIRSDPPPHTHTPFFFLTAVQ